MDQQQHGETPLETPLETTVETPTDEQPRAEMLAAERANRMAKHTQMRALIAWLVEHRFAHKQVTFCDAIGLAPVELSRYKNGKTSKGKEMMLSELDTRHKWLCTALQKAQLPLEIPIAGAIPASPFPPHDSGSASIPVAMPQQPASSTVNTAPPKAAVLTVNLRDVEGAHQGGQVHLVNLGVPVADVRWQIARPGPPLYLRDGLRGRRSLAARRGSTLGGRIFEWWVETINSRQDLAHHGGPLWVARELNGSISCLGQRIIGRFPTASGGHVGPSSPFLLATAIARHCGVEVRIQGLVLTGLIHPAVQELLDAAAESAGLQEPEAPAAPVSTFGARSGGLSGLKEGGSRLREVGDAAGVAFLQAMESIAPDNPEGVFAQLMKKPSFRARFLTPEWRDGLSKAAVQEQMLKTPFVAMFVKVGSCHPCLSYMPHTIPSHRTTFNLHRSTKTSRAFAPNGSCSRSLRHTSRMTSQCACLASAGRPSTSPSCTRLSTAARGRCRPVLCRTVSSPRRRRA
jgi:hypothetical protein